MMRTTLIASPRQEPRRLVMPCTTIGAVSPPRARRSPTALVVLGLAMLFAQTVGHAQVPDALPFSRSYLITGNYVVGGVNLAPSSSGGGFLTGTINMSGVPANADILGAFLYWEMITTDISQANGARFRGSLIPTQTIKASSQMVT